MGALAVRIPYRSSLGRRPVFMHCEQSEDYTLRREKFYHNMIVLDNIGIIIKLFDIAQIITVIFI